MPSPPFDLHRFSETLYRETAAAFPRILSELGHEGVYSLALYTSGAEWAYLFPTVATVAGLERVATHYRTLPRYQRFPLEDLSCLLKWSPCDSPHHEAYVGSLPETHALIQPVADVMESLGEEDAEAFHEKLVGTCLDVLRRLDRSGTFGEGKARTEITVNVLNGDQSDEERLERARHLNPAAVWRRFAKELEAAAEACQS